VNSVPPLMLAFLVAIPMPRAEPADAVDPGPSQHHAIGWRGDGSGQYPSANPVTRWKPEENVLWKTEVGAGHSSPIVVGGRVLVTSEPDVLVCLDAETGRELWRKAHRLADVSTEGIRVNGPSNGIRPGDQLTLILLFLTGERVRYSCEIKHVDPKGEFFGATFTSPPQRIE